MDILLKSDARAKTTENLFFFFSEGLRMLTCALDGYEKCKCYSRHTSLFFFFSIIIMTKALLYLKQF